MNNIVRMIKAAVASSGEPVSLLVEPTVGGFSVALVNVETDETITYQTDWKSELACEGTTLEEALAELDDACGEDFLVLEGGGHDER